MKTFGALDDNSQVRAVETEDRDAIQRLSETSLREALSIRICSVRCMFTYRSVAYDEKRQYDGKHSAAGGGNL
jgi:hypothetical protein